MRKTLAAAAAILLSLGAPAYTHRLDEYLQATIISVEKDRVQAFMRLVPGVAVSSIVISSIDTNGDGIISDTEQQGYAERMLRDLSLSVDGHPLKLRLVSVDFPAIGEMKEGLGQIQIEFTADLPRSTGSNRRLIFENHHQSRIAAYLMNCLVPLDKNIQITAQNRNENQSFYQLDYVQGDGRSGSRSLSKWWSGVRLSLGSSVGFVSIFRLGIRHIAEGTDHLLFLLALLLPAPLIVSGSRWAGFAGVHHSVLRILKVVTAFTVGHSITLAIAALGLIRVPSRPIEVLIAVSILVSAAHAFRPLFPGREPGIAAFFGLIHGLAFATTLGQLGLGRWERVASILAFNLGIETMQLVVVAATMPSLVLLSRTRAYSVLRIGGALFAGFASVGWIAERLLDVHNSVDLVVNSVAHHAVWIAAVLFLISLVCWSLHEAQDARALTVTPFN
ncbi:MAG: HupE/UreJ family protein [Bryobacteraceae bacterium]